MGLLKFLFITITILWLIKQLVRFILPIVILKWANKIQDQAAKSYQYEKAEKKDGKIRVEYIPNTNQKKQRDDTLGDFIDYEEVK
mgnify:CR=1 FL=1